MRLIATVRATLRSFDIETKIRINQDMALTLDLMALRCQCRIEGDPKPSPVKINDNVTVPGWAFDLVRETKPGELDNDTAINLLMSWEDDCRAMLGAVAGHAAYQNARFAYDVTSRIESYSHIEAAIIARDFVKAGKEIPA